MKMIDTLTTQEKISMLNGNSVGIFNKLIIEGDAFYTEKNSMCANYYVGHSGSKTVSPVFERVTELVNENQSSFTDTPSDIIAGMIRSKFLEKWSKVYNSLKAEYNPLKEYEHTEEKDGENTDTTEYDSSVTKSGENSDTITYDTETTTVEDIETNEVKSVTRENSNDIYGFNSQSSVGDSESNESSEETLTRDPEENITHNEQTKTGTDTKAIVIDETETKSGKDTKTFEIDETIDKYGRETVASKLLNYEIDFRTKQIFYDIVFRDIDSIATIYIYI